MIVVEEIDFYTRFLQLKKERGLKWSAFSAILGMTDAAMRMAFRNESLKEYEKQKIENYFDSNGKTLTINDGDISIHKDGVTVTLDEIANLAAHNEEEFFAHKYFANYVDLRVAKEVNRILSTKKNLDDFLDT